MTRSTLALTALSLLTAAGCQRPQVIEIPASASAAEKVSQLTVVGTATLEISPDCADLVVTLGADAQHPAEATRDVDRRKTALVAALGKLGVAPEDLKLARLELEPVTELIEKRYRLTHYHAEMVITATTHDFAKLGDMMEAGAEAGATAMTSQLRRSDMPTLKKKVRDMALAAAKDKAAQTANALGFKFGRVLTVAENQGGMMWDNAYFPVSNNVAATQDVRTALGGELQPLSLSVTVGFEIERET